MSRRPLALREPSPDDLLGGADAEVPAEHVGRVEEVDPVRDGRIHDGVRVRLGGVRPEVHGPQTQPADDQTEMADVRVLHAVEFTPGLGVSLGGAEPSRSGPRAPGMNIGDDRHDGAQRRRRGSGSRRSPIRSASGPTTANDSGSPAIEIIQSRLDHAAQEVGRARAAAAACTRSRSAARSTPSATNADEHAPATRP